MILFLNGSINAGKSTVAQLLKARLARPAVVEIDRLHDFIRGVDIDEAIPVLLETAAAVIGTFARRGYSVIVPYPLSEADFAYLEQRLRPLNSQIYAVTLRPSLAKAQTSTPERMLSDWEVKRVAHHYSIGLTDAQFGPIIDSTLLTPAQTAEAVLRVLNLT